MSDNDIHGIERGWSVKSVDGQSIGSVEEVTETYILVKSGLINTDHRYFPAGVLEHVRPEMSEIGISLTQEQVGHMAGTTRPTTNRVLRAAEDAGIVRMARGHIDVLNPDALARRAR